MRIGVAGFVLLTWVVAIADRDPLWAVWGLWGLVPFVMVCRLPSDVRQRVSRFFPP
jgi:hypothetical protein